MRGDKLVLKPEHRKAARKLVEFSLPMIKTSGSKFVLAVGGESGSGKSELALLVSRVFKRQGVSSLVLQQDDYFVYPPHTNAKMRKAAIARVGVSEVRLDLLDQHLALFRRGTRTIAKPLVVYQEDRITTETVSLQGIRAVVVEGTYTTLLENVNVRVFIERPYYQTNADRLKRARETQDEYLDQVLEIEHRIIAGHKELADIIVGADYEVYVQKEIKPVSSSSKLRSGKASQGGGWGTDQEGYVRRCAKHSKTTNDHQRREYA